MNPCQDAVNGDAKNYSSSSQRLKPFDAWTTGSYGASSPGQLPYTGCMGYHCRDRSSYDYVDYGTDTVGERRWVLEIVLHTYSALYHTCSAPASRV